MDYNRGGTEPRSDPHRQSPGRDGGGAVSGPWTGTLLLLVLLVVFVLVVGPISTAAMKAYCTLTPMEFRVIHVQRRCTPSGVRDLC
jgi:hypothetical protein